MDFSDTPQEARYRSAVRAWLDQNAPKERRDFAMESTHSVPESKAWQAKKAAAGYACITWPKEWGGQGGSPIEDVIFREEEAKHPTPPNLFLIGLGMCVPTVLKFGDQKTIDRFAAPAIRGDEVWCQLFSEPSGGSDLASARTRAELAPDGSGDWILNGQKVWTTGAHLSDFGLVLCRTDPNAPKHKGLTMFWVDMKADGILVRPIHQMSGESGFNEVFFSAVRVSDAQRVGEVNDGWNVALFTLMNERLVAGAPLSRGWGVFLDLAKSVKGEDGAALIKDSAIREKLADWYVAGEGLRHIANRTLTALSRGDRPGPEGAIGKIITGLQMQDIANASVELLEQYGLISDPALSPARGLYHGMLLYSPGHRLAGGSDEILKNIIAERVLGLPADVRADKGIPFKDIPTGL